MVELHAWYLEFRLRFCDLVCVWGFFDWSLVQSGSVPCAQCRVVWHHVQVRFALVPFGWARLLLGSLHGGPLLVDANYKLLLLQSRTDV